MPIAVDSLIQTTVLGLKDQQNVLNVFWYRCTSAPSTGTVAENLEALILKLWEVDLGTMEPLWTAVMPDDYTLNAIRAQVIKPVRTAYVEKLIVDLGDLVADQIQTANLSWVFVKQSDAAGRRGKGTTHMLLPVSTWMSNGSLTGVGSADREALIAAIPQIVTVAAGGTYEPIIYHPDFSPAFSRITHCTIKSEIRTMSRRTVGRGI